MLIAYWIVAGITAVAFLATAVLKLVRSKDALRRAGLGWVDDFETGPIKLIGAVEVLGAAGLILPMLLGIVPILSPIAAVCLAVLMIGATVVHVRRHEPPIPLVFLALAVVSAVLGFLLVL